MAVRTELIRICDLCGSDVGVRQYRISFVAENESRSIDLCTEDQKPLEEIRKKFPGRRGRGQPVVTTKQVQAAHTRKRPAAKRTSPRRAKS